jgi:hypothetical protein
VALLICLLLAQTESADDMYVIRTRNLGFGGGDVAQGSELVARKAGVTSTAKVTSDSGDTFCAEFSQSTKDKAVTLALTKTWEFTDPTTKKKSSDKVEQAMTVRGRTIEWRVDFRGRKAGDKLVTDRDPDLLCFHEQTVLAPWLPLFERKDIRELKSGGALKLLAVILHGDAQVRELPFERRPDTSLTPAK